MVQTDSIYYVGTVIGAGGVEVHYEGPMITSSVPFWEDYERERIAEELLSNQSTDDDGTNNIRILRSSYYVQG